MSTADRDGTKKPRLIYRPGPQAQDVNVTWWSNEQQVETVQSHGKLRIHQPLSIP